MHAIIGCGRSSYMAPVHHVGVLYYVWGQTYLLFQTKEVIEVDNCISLNIADATDYRFYCKQNFVGSIYSFDYLFIYKSIQRSYN